MDRFGKVRKRRAGDIQPRRSGEDFAKTALAAIFRGQFSGLGHKSLRRNYSAVEAVLQSQRSCSASGRHRRKFIEENQNCGNSRNVPILADVLPIFISGMEEKLRKGKAARCLDYRAMGFDRGARPGNFEKVEKVCHRNEQEIRQAFPDTAVDLHNLRQAFRHGVADGGLRFGHASEALAVLHPPCSDFRH